MSENLQGSTSATMIEHITPGAGGRDLLHQLPNELLLEVLKNCADFTSLWSLIHTSPLLSLLFVSQNPM